MPIGRNAGFRRFSIETERHGRRKVLLSLALNVLFQCLSLFHLPGQYGCSMGMLPALSATADTAAELGCGLGRVCPLIPPAGIKVLRTPHGRTGVTPACGG